LRGTLLLDTGPLVALLAPAEPHHRWATEVLRVKARVLTCEAVLSEAFFLLRGSDKASRALRAMVADDALELATLSSEAGPITKLMERYSSVPMSFADACLVRLSEMIPRVVVATIDSDFLVYRRNSRQVIPLLMP
jgi:uncharacterized protein